MRMPQPPQNVLAPADIRSLAELADFELVKAEIRLAGRPCGCWALDA